MSDKKQIGLAVIGCGVVGRMRATLARDFPGIGWIGLSDVNEKVGHQLRDDIDADFTQMISVNWWHGPKSMR